VTRIVTFYNAVSLLAIIIKPYHISDDVITPISAVLVTLSCHFLTGIFCWFEICQTGPKGVVEDWRRYKQLEMEMREEHVKEKEMLARKLAVTCRSQVTMCSLLIKLNDLIFAFLILKFVHA